MKRVVIGIFLLLIVAATASLIPSRAQESGTASANAAEPAANSDAQAPTKNWPDGNPLKIAQLKWYQANTTTRFAVHSQPYGVTFDGANIWTANFGDGTVAKLRANDGEVLGTFKVGGAPYGVTFDGANIWVSNQGAGAVIKLQASDGKVLGTFTVGPYPGWMAFDGE